MKSFPINKIVDKIILNVMVAPSLLESLTSILTSEGCWKNQLKSYNLFFFLNVSVLLPIILFSEKWDAADFLMCVHTNTQIPVGFHIAVESRWLFARLFLTPPWWNQVVFGSVFDYASVEPCKRNDNGQIHQARIPSMIKNRPGFEREGYFESRAGRKEVWTCFFRCKFFYNQIIWFA